MRSIIRRFLRDDEAATAVEYALIAGLIAVALVTAMGTLTTEIQAAFTYIGSKLPGG